MRVLFVVQRYGVEVAGGAEQSARLLATHLVEAGHEVHVLTSRAVSSLTWDNAYPPGSSELDGVAVHRLATAGPRDEELFDELSRCVLWSGRPAAPVVQEAWLRAQGPVLPDLAPWLRERAERFDAIDFFTYLFWPTWAGLAAVGSRLPTVLHAAAHDEAPFWLPLFDLMLHRPDAYAWFSEEERDLLARRGVAESPGAMIGVGVDIGPPGDPAGFRRRAGLGERPYLLCVGRVAPEKGTVDLIDWFAAYKARRPGPLALVVVGEGGMFPAASRDVVITGFVDDETRASALAGAEVLVQPSYFESFSMVLAEAWAAGKPALVQGLCPVLAGQVTRNGGGLAYTGYAEFEAGLDLLLASPSWRSQLGLTGRDHVERLYQWPQVVRRYEELISIAHAERARRVLAAAAR